MGLDAALLQAETYNPPPPSPMSEPIWKKHSDSVQSERRRSFLIIIIILFVMVMYNVKFYSSLLLYGTQFSHISGTVFYEQRVPSVYLSARLTHGTRVEQEWILGYTHTITNIHFK